MQLRGLVSVALATPARNHSPMGEIERYSWVAQATEATIAVVAARGTVSQLLERLGPVAEHGNLSFQEALELQGSLYDNDTFDHLAVVQCDELPGHGETWAVTVEPNGFRASSEESLMQLAAGAPAASFFWNVNAVMRFLWIGDGDLRVAFDPLLEPETAPVEAAGLDFEDQPAPSSMALLERLTGVMIKEEWFLDAKPTFVISTPIR